MLVALVTLLRLTPERSTMVSDEQLPNMYWVLVTTGAVAPAMLTVLSLGHSLNMYSRAATEFMRQPERLMLSTAVFEKKARSMYSAAEVSRLETSIVLRLARPRNELAMFLVREVSK